MQILIADKFSERGREALEGLGHHLRYEPSLGAEELAAATRESKAAVLVVRSTRVNAEVFAEAPRLALVVRAGAGVNTIDLEAASRRGVFVANCPGKNATAVAELSMGLMLSLDRRIPEASADLAAGRWNKKLYGGGRGLLGRTLGVVGFGAIAKALIVRARAFGMDVRVWTRSPRDAEIEAMGAIPCAKLEELLALSDVVSLHVPLNASTRHLIGSAELGAMRDGAYLIHTSRGGVVDDEALAEAVHSGRLRAACDVFEGEPGSGQAEFQHPLLTHPSFVGTPHIGASTQQAAEAIAQEAVRIVDAFAERGEVPNSVNLKATAGGGFRLIVRHLDRVGVLANVLGSLRRERLNVQEMQNVVFEGNDAACATIRLEREPSVELMEELASAPEILAVDLRGESA